MLILDYLFENRYFSTINLPITRLFLFFLLWHLLTETRVLQIYLHYLFLLWESNEPSYCRKLREEELMVLSIWISLPFS